MMNRNLPISLLSGVSRQAREHLQANGITSLHQIAAMQPDDLRRFKGIKSTAPAIHACARAYVEERAIWFSPLPGDCLENGIMFDIETDPFTGRVWSWGWCDHDGNAQNIIVAHRNGEATLPDGRVMITVQDGDTGWRLFSELNPLAARIYHWTGFDAGVMRAQAPDEVKEQLDMRMYDLHHSYKSCVRFPVYGASLKVVARWLGFEWDEYDAWDAAYRDYRQWLLDDDPYALMRAANYQRADVVALAIMWKWLTENRSEP
ncbi:MAG: ribonuclease H-like domain-containing protein [Anaerolinea sp.]|nr:ribonuclease H-like domain-containing protein [Anaerolinea sp.]